MRKLQLFGVPDALFAFAGSPWHAPTVNRHGLNKREISWLLAQEARGAAKALKQGFEVQVRESLPPSDPDQEPTALSVPVLDSLATLDEAMALLGDLQSRKGSGRRGRLDVAALLYELTPEATINIDAASGTEVFGEEEGVRRMLQLLLSDSASQSSSATAAPQIHVSRDGETVRITAELGPDAAHHSALERRWLSRMALRAGGQLEITGRAIALFLPADGAAAQKELAELRQELEQAQELGEAYARELAGVLTAAENQAETARHHEEESSWWGAQSLAQSILHDLSHSTESTPPSLVGLLNSAVRAGKRRGQTRPWSEMQPEFVTAGIQLDLGINPPPHDLEVPAVLPILIEWMRLEALAVEPELGPEVKLDYRHGHSLSASLAINAANDCPSAHTKGVPWSLLRSFIQETPHEVARSRQQDNHINLSLKITL